MKNKIFKLLGGLVLTGVLATQVFGAAAVISISGITTNAGAAVPVGAYVQIIESANASIGAPSATGAPAGDTVVVTGTINPAGTFQSGASITASRYVAIRVWQTWTGTGTPSGYYGTSPAEDVGAGFVYNYDPAGFTCSTQYGSTSSTGETVTIAPTSAYVGQTITITGTGFGATKGASTVTIGGRTVHPTAWSATSITAAVPSGVSGAAPVVVTVSGTTHSGTLSITAGGAVIDDYEGGCVDNWEFDYGGTSSADSGYYVFASVQDITPNNDAINTDLAQASAAMHGTRGARVRYSYVGTDGSDWGGGWGASLANTLDLDAYSTINFYIRWDGSANSFKLSLKDSKGTIYFTTISNAQLAALAGAYGEIRVNKSSFAFDVDDPANVAGTLNWREIVSYNLAYTTNRTSVNYHAIDSITAGTVDLGTGTGDGDDDGTVTTSEVVIDRVTPSAAPAGTHFTVTGREFGSTQGPSMLYFENQETRTSYPVEIRSWGNTTIEARIPTPAPVGNYALKVIKIAVSAGTVRASESNPTAMSVTGAMAQGAAVVFPNPFNPLATTMAANGMPVNQTTIAFSTTGSQNIGIYIYDMTGRLVRHDTTTDTQVVWNGRDQNNNVVADGLYLLRIVNEETNKLIAKGKILVTKK